MARSNADVPASVCICLKDRVATLKVNSGLGSPPMFFSRSSHTSSVLATTQQTFAKWSVSEEGHPLGAMFGTNTAATFPMLYPSVGFGPLLWTTAQIWPGFCKHACTASRPLYTVLFCKYGRRQLNVGMEVKSRASESGMLKTLCKGHSHSIRKPRKSIFDIFRREIGI